jgi:N-acetylmuramoyl-L-alanine amidase
MLRKNYAGLLAKVVATGLALAMALGVLGNVAYAALSHRVERGDTLWRLSRLYRTTVPAIQAANGLSGDLILVDQVLVIPEDNSDAGDFDAESVELMARMIVAEAEGEPYLGMVAVGAVIMNRVESPRFPDTIRAVLFQRGQFEPIANGRFWRVQVREIHRRAARAALAGMDPTGGALFFFAPRKTNNRFMWSRPVIMDIANHRFTH